MLKLINAGLGRTGTTSLQVALERLGFGPCYHMFDIVGSQERLAQWEKIVCDGQSPDWPEVFDGYTSAVDGPPAIYYRQIVEAFPETKVVLTVRDAERWYQSTYETLYQFVANGQAPPPGSPPARLRRVVNTMVWDGLFDGRFADKDYAIEVYHNRNQEIVNTVHPDKLLVFDVKQGWEPLCAFLGVDVPAEDFPHANDTENMQQVIKRVASGTGPVSAG
ncbi:sulfotransferase family protein [Kibdelosporangium aridum]|uniref:sulfotransferase family protein n=1 Tax=Kibdelosporangium aridum TaxID=2030 RepID=UPI0009FFFF82|nr:sulfotransferase family protein [Kibdelosporangium aridum]